MEIKYAKPNYSAKLIASLVDIILVGFLMGVFLPLYKINPFLFMLGFIFYRVVTIYFIGSTLGMRIFRMLFLNADEEDLSTKEKVLAAFFILYKGADYYQET